MKIRSKKELVMDKKISNKTLRKIKLTLKSVMTKNTSHNQNDCNDFFKAFIESENLKDKICSEDEENYKKMNKILKQYFNQ